LNSVPRYADSDTIAREQDRGLRRYRLA